MKEISFSKLALFIVLSFLAQVNHAQVTIGSGNQAVRGSILDLKERKVSDGSANSDRGLLLPRVVLTSIQPKIGELAQSIGNTGTWDESAHTGLMVYNVKNTLESCIGGANVGLYNWNGKEWLPLFQKEIPMPSTDYSSDDYTGANSYTMRKDKELEIPIERGFKIWEAYAGTDPTTGKVLSLADVNNLDLGATLSVNVVWQEASDGWASDVLHGNVPVSITGSGPTAKLVVLSGFKIGNALVNVTIGGKVLWQWHIWVTEDEPTATAHMFNTGKHVYWFMDRTLGAMSTSGTAAYGLYYQWGRSTPLRMRDTGFTTIAAATEKENLTAAIQTADFITFGSKTSHDWYSATAKQWDARWGDQSADATVKKSPFDPCPYGWRVAGNIGVTPPWHCLDESTGSGSGGWDFGEIGRDIGFYALAGYRANGDGSLGDVGKTGYIWTATPNEALAGILHFNSTTITPNHKYNRANGMNVRCVKEVQVQP